MSANYTPSYLSAAGNVTTTYADRTAITVPDLKKDIIRSFHAAQIYAPKALMKGTDSHQAIFPASGKMSTPTYHTPGTRLLGGTPPKRNKRTITIDDRLVQHLFIDELDKQVRSMVPFEQMFAEEMGQSIAQFDDQNCAIVVALAARASATVAGDDGGTQISKAGMGTNVGVLNAAIWEMKNSLDEKNVSPMGRTLQLIPAPFNLLAISYDRMFHRDLGQGGSIGANVALPAYAGFESIEMSNNIPTTNVSSNPTGAQNTYSGDFTGTIGTAFQRGAFGTVYSNQALPQGGGAQPNNTTPAETTTPKMPVDVRSVAIPEAYGELLLASLVTGHGILDPRCAGEFVDG